MFSQESYDGTALGYSFNVLLDFGVEVLGGSSFNSHEEWTGNAPVKTQIKENTGPQGIVY